MNKPYTVALHEARDLSLRERIEAEVRFAGELERALAAKTPLPRLIAHGHKRGRCQ
jgi:hypothetical protein